MSKKPIPEFLREACCVLLTLLTGGWGMGSVCCSSTSEEVPRAGLEVDVARAALQSLPQIRGDQPVAGVAALSGALDTWEGTAQDTVQLEWARKMFRFGCHNGSVDFCPPEIPASDANRFDEGSLIGLIYAVQRNLGLFARDDRYERCELGNAATALTDHALFYRNAGGTTDRHPLVLPFPALLDCVSHISESGGTTRNTAYTRTLDRQRLATLFVDRGYLAQAYLRLKVPAATELERPDPDVGPGDAGLAPDATPGALYRDLAVPVVAAINHNALAEKADGTLRQRAVLLYNVETHRFVLRAQEEHSGGSLAAIGTGGIDEATGRWVEGHFLLRTEQSGGGDPGLFCMANDGQGTVDATREECAWLESEGFVHPGEDTGYRAEVARFLDLDAADQTDLTSFVEFLSSSGAIPREEMPLEADSFPQELSPTP